ncbi:MAG: hypothetical protein U1F36_21340 [Planctomycetota bacterium]
MTRLIPSRSVRLALLLAASASLDAQQLISYLPGVAGGTFYEECAPSAACGTPGVPVSHSFAAPARPIVGVLDGDVAVDDRAGVIFSTNGYGMIARNRFPRLGCVGAGALAALPFPPGMAVIRGMAVDPAARLLLLTDGNQVFTVDPGAGMATLAAFPSGLPVQLTGLCFDPALPGEILAVTAAADVVRYQRATGAILGVTPAIYAPPGSHAVGLAQDRTSAGGGHVFVLHAGGEVFDHTTGALLRTLAAGRVGLAFAPDALRLPGAVACAGATAEPRTSSLAFAGNAAFGLELCGIPAGTTFAVALIGLPSTPVSVATLPSGLLWVAGAPIALGVPVPAGSTSVAIPLSLAGITPPVDFDVQWGLPCAASAVGHVLTEGLQIEVGR